ncbi:TonB family protein [Stenotrophomonas sp. 24(2023)]|uniref:M56 family metallopeptidase n=1 Tax=Stenotrophomonas sp. 24(2023) TaxID=3068324 RepID=UPI0027E14CB2|nr:TonB family protein [Stenotrophomonas sp. 24(2023)]WMJ70332.1 TonB family protein [Stenotrophomonas sp. 24(2023)]
MNELIDLLLRASAWLAVGVLVLAVLRPVLLALGGAALAYRSWWLLPLLLLAPQLPMPAPVLEVVTLPVLTLGVLPGPVGATGDAPGWPLVCVLLWALGVAVVAWRSTRAQRGFQQALGRLTARADGSWQASGDPGLPALVGLWQPRIVVGPDFDTRFTSDEQHMVLQHERNHRRHGDHWANGVLLVLRCLFWFHPLLPWAARRFLRDQELACDARTIAPHPALRRLYATALLKAQLAHLAAPMACHWRSQPLLKERIAMLKQNERKTLPWVSGQVLLVGMCVSLGAVAWASQGGGGGVTTISAEPFATAQADAARAALDRPVQVDRMTPPTYPKSAVALRQTGVVTLQVDVTAQGTVQDVRVVSATNPGVFDAESMAAARRWTYQPALKNGTPVAASVRIPITFAMDESETHTENGA